MMNKIFRYFRAAGLVCCTLATVLASCSKEDPFFTASENDAPRILNTDIPEWSNGSPGTLMSLDRTTNFTFNVVVTPKRYTTVTWFLDDELIFEGDSIDMPLLAGDHILKIVATTTKGLSTSRTTKLIVRALENDPALASDAKSRWLTIGATKTIECTNATSVEKVFVGQQEAANVSFDNGKLTFDVPSMEEGDYMVSIEDAAGMRYGCGWFTVSNDEYVDPGVKETVLWKGSTDINWGDSNVLVSTQEMEAVPVGATIRMYFELIDAEYHAMRVTTPWWGDNAEDQLVAQFDLTDETPNPYEFTYTDAHKAIVDERGGMLVVGFGYKLTKIVVVENVAPAENELWKGSTDINWGDSNVLVSTQEMEAVPVGATIHMYFELIDAEYHAMRVTTPWWGDNAEDQLVAQFDLTDETPNPYEFTYTDAHKTIVDERGGMLVVGFGYKLTRITYGK